MLAQLCDLDRWSLQVVRCASAALASIAVGPDVKVCVLTRWTLALQMWQAAGCNQMLTLMHSMHCPASALGVVC